MNRLGETFLPGIRALFRKPKTQIPALDGLRSLAILLVIATHTCIDYKAAGGRANFLSEFRLFTGGWVGVDLFFVLSGYLIGQQLWRELERSGSIHFGRFFVRRGLRIWPLYFSVFLVTLLYFWMSGAGFPPLWPEGVFLANYYDGAYIGGSWSLSTEEQFYIFTPLLLIGLGAMVRSRRLQTMRWILIGIFACLPIIRFLVLSHAVAGAKLDESFIIRTLYQPIHTHADALIFGVILANIMTDRAARDRYAKWPGWLVLGAFVVSGALLRKLNLLIFEYVFLAFSFGSLTWYCLHASERNWIVRAFSWKGFYFISKLSFGMYLMHQYAMSFLIHTTFAAIPESQSLLRFVVFGSANLAVAIFSAIIGYILIEYPFLRLRERLGFGAAH